MGAKYMAKLTVTLLLIAAVVAGLLGYVNSITEGRIADIKAQKTETAMREVMAEADEFLPLDYTDDLVTGVYQAKSKEAEAGYVVMVAPMGYAGAIDMVVGVSEGGTVTGISIVKMTETSGLGANAKNQSFRDQYLDQSGPLAVNKDGGTIDALSGATVTSRAVTRGVNAALAAAQLLAKEG